MTKSKKINKINGSHKKQFLRQKKLQQHMYIENISFLHIQRNRTTKNWHKLASYIHIIHQKARISVTKHV